MSRSSPSFAISRRAVDSMMICHGWYPCFNPARRPASLSREIVTNLLRDEFEFDGLIMTDDLDMGAILNEYGLEETIRLAIEAGNDLADDLPPRSLRSTKCIARWANCRRRKSNVPSKVLLAPKQSCRRRMNFRNPLSRKSTRSIWDLRVAVLGEEEAAKRSPEDGKRSPVETY